jgi:hypothetical protein
LILRNDIDLEPERTFSCRSRSRLYDPPHS